MTKLEREELCELCMEVTGSRLLWKKWYTKGKLVNGKTHWFTLEQIKDFLLSMKTWVENEKEGKNE